jgi:hypothetical protein
MTTATQARVNNRVVAQTQAKLLALMQAAVVRANGGVKPSPADMREHAALFDNPKTGTIQLWWLGETVLLLAPTADGFNWQFMGAAAKNSRRPVPDLSMTDEHDSWARAFPAPGAMADMQEPQ